MTTSTTPSNNRTAEALRSIPPTTMGFIGLCILLYIFQTVLGWNLQLFTMCPRLVLLQHEYHRVFTSAVFHANLMHIGMNMLSASAIGSALEKIVGTTRLFVSISWAIPLTSGIYLLTAFVAGRVFGYNAWMYQHAVGFSGILFHLSVLESRLHSGNRTIFGSFSVPAAVYPWVLLVVLQIFMPNLSFLGHLAGILTGTLEYYGFLDCIFASDSFLIELESQPILRWLVSLDSFVGTTGQRLRAESSSSSGLLYRAIRRPFDVISKFVRDLLETLLVCVCGRTCKIPRFWERRTARSDIECGVIRPPEFYEGDMEEDELEPLASTMV